MVVVGCVVVVPPAALDELSQPSRHGDAVPLFEPPPQLRRRARAEPSGYLTQSSMNDWLSTFDGRHARQRSCAASRQNARRFVFASRRLCSSCSSSESAWVSDSPRSTTHATGVDAVTTSSSSSSVGPAPSSTCSRRACPWPCSKYQRRTSPGHSSRLYISAIVTSHSPSTEPGPSASVRASPSRFTSSNGPPGPRNPPRAETPRDGDGPRRTDGEKSRVSASVGRDLTFGSGDPETHEVATSNRDARGCGAAGAGADPGAASTAPLGAPTVPSSSLSATFSAISALSASDC